MASATSPTSTDASNVASLPADAISYEDLYARWERGNWSAMELDFTEDARQWREDFTEFERQAALWNYSLFFWGEDAVADNLSPYIDAAPREEQKYFLTTQQVDEARHAVFFKRFMQEVCGIGDGSMASGLDAIKPQLTVGFRKIFDRLDTMADELRADRSPAQLAAAVTLYHIVIEAALAQPGQHFICSYLEERDQLPAFREGKVARVGQWLAEGGLSWRDFGRVTVYSDSLNDLALLERATEPVAANPSPELEALARQRGWRIMKLFE